MSAETINHRRKSFPSEHVQFSPRVLPDEPMNEHDFGRIPFGRWDPARPVCTARNENARGA